MLRTVSIVASLVILLLSSDSAAQVTEKTDTGWIALNSSGYHLSLEPMNWSTAQTHCHEKGARLLSLPSNTEVSKLLAEIELYTKQRSWWLGVRRNSSVSSTWVSLNETSPFYGLITLWNKDQPDNWKDKEGCAMMQPSGLLNDLPCAKRLKFICERHLMIAHNASSMECGHGWIFIPPSCYKFSINAASWSEAQNECRENKGNLLTVNSLEELLQIKKAMFRANKEACWWIGIWKISTNNSWAWLEGPPHLASLVIQWKKSEPNNVLGKEDCVMMDSDGLLSDVPCDSSRYFICSRDANKIKDCGGGWTLIHHACYRMSTRTAAWPDAQKECQTEGGSLLTVKTVYELMEILTEAKRVSSRWLVDVRRISRDRSTWEWLDSTTVFSSLAIPWDKNKPSSPASNRDCAEMDYSGLLNDAPCYSLLPYICEKPLMDHSKTCDFMWDLLNGICYVHFTRAMSWSDAQESCQKSGSNLLSINSLDERKWVLRMLKAKARRWWVGLQRTSPSYNAWKWLDSVTDFSSHVTPWGKNEPNDMGGDENCAEISPRGLLNDESCSESFGFICEKSSNTTSENRAEECGMDWILFNNACYKLSTNQMTWSQAQKKCQAGGANLLSINSLDELNMIQSEIRKVSERWWIGLKRTPGYETRSFVPPTNLPSPVMTESDCVEMTPGGFLSYINCSDIRQFICENQKGQDEVVRRSPRRASSATRTAMKFGHLYARDMSKLYSGIHQSARVVQSGGPCNTPGVVVSSPDQETSVFLGQLNRMATLQTVIHRLDPGKDAKAFVEKWILKQSEDYSG